MKTTLMPTKAGTCERCGSAVEVHIWRHENSRGVVRFTRAHVCHGCGRESQGDPKTEGQNYAAHHATA